MARFRAVARIRYFASAREAAGTAAEEVPGHTVGEVLAAAVERHGERLEAVLATAAVWLDGEPCGVGDAVATGSEVAVLPPVSGGCQLLRQTGASVPSGLGGTCGGSWRRSRTSSSAR